MKRFLKNISFFIIPFLIGVVLIYLAPYSKEYAYGYRKNVDCNTSWIYYRLYQNTTPVDIAFMGTSHTGCGINDSLIETNLFNQYGNTSNIVNLAYCTNGRNIQLPLIKDLLKTKKPKIIILEVTEDENTTSHQDFPYIADLEDIFQPELVYNPTVIDAIYKAFSSRFNYSRKRLTRTLTLKKPSTFRNNHSYVPFPFFAKKEVLAEHKKNQASRYKKKSLNLIRKIEISYPKKYLEKIINLADKKSVKLIFLYLPSFGSTLKTPLEYNYYNKKGDVWIPPDSVFTCTNNWVDGEHLNANGSTQLASWLTKKISKLK